uniref:Ovule protein n=1 Tax=Heterorhabditis bacteriophora TaxID=37862 RepID=A0A1I7WUH5_HETBA
MLHDVFINEGILWSTVNVQSDLFSTLENSIAACLIFRLILPSNIDIVQICYISLYTREHSI